MYIPDVHHNVSEALQALASETHAIEFLTDEPLQEWWASLTYEWWWAIVILGAVRVSYSLGAVVYTAVVAFGSLTKGPLQKTLSLRLYGEAP